MLYLVKVTFYFRLPFESQNIENAFVNTSNTIFLSMGNLSNIRHISLSCTLANSLSEAPAPQTATVTSSCSHRGGEEGGREGRGDREWTHSETGTAFTWSQTPREKVRMLGAL